MPIAIFMLYRILMLPTNFNAKIIPFKSLKLLGIGQLSYLLLLVYPCLYYEALAHAWRFLYQNPLILPHKKRLSEARRTYALSCSIVSILSIICFSFSASITSFTIIYNLFYVIIWDISIIQYLKSSKYSSRSYKSIKCFIW